MILGSKFNPLAVILAVSAALQFGTSAAYAQQRYLAPSSVVNVLRNGGNYVTYSGQQCLKWETGGVTLSKVETGPGYPAKYTLPGSTVNGTIAMDGLYNECVAFVRMTHIMLRRLTRKPKTVHQNEHLLAHIA